MTDFDRLVREAVESVEKPGAWRAEEPRAFAIARHAAQAADREARRERWTLVADAHPPPHGVYLVQRADFPNSLAVATVCYGMHDPWWCVETHSHPTADPIGIKPDDRWMDAAALRDEET